jgi:hypothetical protein
MLNDGKIEEVLMHVFLTSSSFAHAVDHQRILHVEFDCVSSAAWRNGIASDYDRVIRRLQVRPLRWSFLIS